MSTDRKEPDFAPRRRRRRRRAVAWLAIALALPALLYFIASLLFPFPAEEIEAAKQRRVSTVVLDRDGRLLRPFLGKDDTWLFWSGLDRMSPRLVEATLAVEDERFYRHMGVDPIAVGRAVWTNLRSGRVVSGASTITMQVIRLLEQRPLGQQPPRTRGLGTLRNKMVESFRAVQLERLLSKREILELYLNLASYGGNLVGPEAASQSYFRKRAADLTLGEAALLAGLVQCPSWLRPDRHPERARHRRDHVLKRMQTCGYIGGEQLQAALRQPVETIPRTPFPFEAPHLAQMLHRKNARQTTWRTTLDYRIQTLAETAICEAVAAVRLAGISNGAGVVIENETGAVKALVGSCDFFSEEDCGQLNGATALRSPGSALKPFIYAMAFDQGVITPGSVLADAPISYAGYEPRNYDHAYRGPVTAREALCASLNVPAVMLLQKVGHRQAYSFLREVGLTGGRDADYYGLSLALGSMEVTLLDLTNAYAALARLGEYRPYRLLEAEPISAGRRVLSEGAAYLLADVLSDADRAGGTTLWKSEKGRLRMAWKTGTSYGHRDAWTIAYTPEYTVGVWMGNFSGRGAHGLAGVETAAPVAARIMELIYAERTPTPGPASPPTATAGRGRGQAWYAAPASVGVREVCVASGMVPGDCCSARSTDSYIRGVSLDQSCSVHTLIRVDAETGCRLCRSCPAGRPFVERVVEVWGVELAAWFRQGGRSHAEMPPHFAGCVRARDEGPKPRILSPVSQQTYVLAEGEGSHQELLLKAATAGAKVHWFVDGALYRTSSPMEQTFWPLQRGTHKVVCSDESGRSASAVIHVQ